MVDERDERWLYKAEREMATGHEYGLKKVKERL
jgi:hypothetical protein